MYSTKELPVHACGSVAFILKKEFQELLSKRGFKLGQIISQPIHQLMEYHKALLDKH